MKKYFLLITVTLIVAVAFISFSFNDKQQPQQKFIIEHEIKIARREPGTHNGGGNTIGYSFFSKANDLKLVFRKRVLKPGAAIGYHLQNEDEIYYIISGNGIMKMNDSTFTVQAGDAILTRPGSSHGLQQTGKEDLVIIINYEAK
jgi:mannose-6-phosphate isomerase-like protein (cupin superfamily)